MWWRWARLGDLGAAILTTGAMMALVLSAGGIWQHVGGSDLHGYSLPHYIEAARAIVYERRLPLWNPNEYCGAPLLAGTQGMALYLPMPLLFAVLSPYWALQGLYATNLLVLSWGCIALLRAEGVPRAVGAAAALIIVAGLFRSPSGVAIDHPNFLASAAWVPWMLLAWCQLLRQGIRPWLGVLALVLGAQWLAGYPDFPMDTTVLLGLIALISGDAPLHRRLGLAAAGIGLGTALAAVQLLPLAEAVGQSFRAVAEHEYVRTRAFFALGSTGLWRHQLAGTFGPGIPALVLAALALARPTRTRLAWAAAAIWAAFALDPPLALLYELPPFRSVRYPIGWSHLVPVLVGLLAALGASELWRGQRLAGRILLVVLLGAATTRAATMIRHAPTRGHIEAPDYTLLAERRAVFQRALDAFSLPPRVASTLEMNTGSYLRERLPGGAGYDPSMPPARPRRLIDAVNEGANLRGRALLVHNQPQLARLLGIGLVAAPPELVPTLRRAGFEDRGPLPPSDRLLYQAPVPRLRFVERLFVEPDDEAVLRRTLDPARDLERSAVVLAADAAGLPAGVELTAPAPTARLVTDEPEHVAIAVETPAPRLLVLADTFYPGWSATLDGAPATIVRTDFAFRGVLVPAGAHRVDFRYRPLSLRLGAMVSGSAALIVAVLIGLPRRRRAAHSM